MTQKQIKLSRNTARNQLAKYSRGLDKTRIRALAKSGGRQLAALADSSGRRLYQQAELLYYMICDIVKGRYRAPWNLLVMIAAALLYFLSPADLIPDLLGGAGFVDDLAVLKLVFALYSDEIDAYAAETFEPKVLRSHFDEIYA
jgi:uncharacterized membrane protein YkvA (DUF1232 family)